MPIVARQRGSRPNAVPRTVGDRRIGDEAPPEDLLPSGGAHPTLAPPAPHRALALDAIHVVRRLRDQPEGPDPWVRPAFAREVQSIRSHLAPIRTRRALAASYGREAGVGGRTSRPREMSALPPLRIAYALRWLELGDGLARPGWIELVAARD